MYKYLLKPLFFLFPAEQAHSLVTSILKLIYWIPGKAWALRKIYTFKNPKLEKELWGLKFPNPVGLAAGFDKEAQYIDELSCFGFGFIEIGTITPKGQAGNPQPRLFRLPKDNALINRMGFNNEGVEVAIKRLKNRSSKIIVGGNIGKNKVTSNEEAIHDYTYCFHALFDYVDYFVVNVSSPNTPNLRALQEKKPLTEILSSLQKLNTAKPKRKPILLKIAPDLSDEQLDDIIEIIGDTGINGVIATNTTINRGGLQTSENQLDKIGKGGLSGQPLRERATEVIKYLHQKSKGSFPIIGVGGIASAQDALDKIEAGASLVQVYTGFIYEGPALVKRINRGILKSLSAK